VAPDQAFDRLQVVLRRRFDGALRRGAHGRSAEGMRSRISCVFFVIQGVERLRS
jgi:hypothetical protein